MRSKRKVSRSSNPLPADILMTLSELGVRIDKVKGEEGWALCPNPTHTDRDPSWSIHLETGEHHCFSCGYGGNFVFLVATVNGWDLRKDDESDRAESWVRKHGGIEVALKRLRGEKAYTKAAPEDVSEADLALFDDPPDYALRERRLSLASCQAYGVLYDREKDYWILPIRDPYTGTLLGWQEKGKGHFDNFPYNMEKGRSLFGLHLVEDIAVLEESPLDPVRLHTVGYDGAVSSYGVHVSDEQMEILCERVKTLYVALDNDEAGRKKEADIWERYRRNVRLMFVNYERTKKKDHGEMTEQEIVWSLEHAISAVRFRPSVDH